MKGYKTHCNLLRATFHVVIKKVYFKSILRVCFLKKKTEISFFLSFVHSFVTVSLFKILRAWESILKNVKAL